MRHCQRWLRAAGLDIGFILKETQGLWCPLAAQSPKPILDSISLQDVEIRLVFNCLQIPPKLPSLLVMLSLDKNINTREL